MTTKTPFVSILINNYNYGFYLTESINSAFNQTYPNTEVIVVDDGSTDNSIEIISRHIGQIELIKQKNSGVSSARNAGVAKSNGEFVAFLDADDYWMTTKISMQYKSLASADAELSYCRMRLVKPDGSFTFSEECRQGNFEKFYSSFPGRTPFPPSSVLMTRSLISSVGEWDIELLNSAEDYDYFRRCSLRTKFVYVDSILVVHREHSQSLTSGPVEKYFEYNLKAIQKMYSDSNMELSFFVKKSGTFKFYLSLAKTYLKKLDLFKCLVMLCLSLLPINSGKIVAKAFSRLS
jgi:glycosyltransferase involved in cell wall biosynthesis